jgi:predicted permease
MLKPSRFERDMADEIAFHLEQRAAELIAGGTPPKQALRQARVEFGAAERIKDECREAHGFPVLETIARDVEYALRGFRKSPGFVAVAVVSLAVAIGANTAIFSLLYDALYDQLPVKQPRELVQALMSSPSGSRWSNLDYPELLPLAEPKSAFSGLMCWTPSEMNLHFAGRAAERVKAHAVSGNYFATLGVKTYSGRPIVSEDDHNGAPPVVVLSYRYWQSKLAGDSSVLGQPVSLNGVPHTVVGIAPPSFFGLDRLEAPDVTVPLHAEPSPPGMFYLVGRLKPGVNPDQARAELNGQWGRILENQKALLATVSPGDRDRMLRTRVDLIPAGSGNWGLQIMFDRPVRLLFLMVAVILAIACVNIANLMLGRAGARSREMALRRALGASRGRLVRQSLTESILLSVSGGALGLLFAVWLHRVLLAGVPWIKSSAMAFRLNEGVLGFTAAVSVLCGILFGLAPGLYGAGAESKASLSGGWSGSPGRNRAARALIAAQVTASVVLVTGAALLVRSLYNLHATNAGFDRDHLLVMKVDLRQSRFQGPGAAGVLSELTGRVVAIPGVRSAAVADGAAFPLGGYSKAIWVEGFGRDANESYQINFNTIGSDFFTTIGVPMLLGRDFEPQDAYRTPEPVVVK